MDTSRIEKLNQLNEILGEDYAEDDTMWTRAYFEEFGIQMEMAWSSASGEDYNTKLALAALVYTNY